MERNRIWLQVKYFPLMTICRGQVFTALRYFFQAYGAFAGKGAAGEFSKERSRGELAVILLKAWASALAGMPAALKKRRVIQGRRKIGTGEISGLLKRYGVGAREIALKR